MSQRELARAAGVAQPTLARLEREDVRVSIAAVDHVLAAVGLRLAVLLVDPVDLVETPELRGEAAPPNDDLRDRAGRRFPAHLPAEHVNIDPSWRFSRRMRRGARPLIGYDPGFTYRRRSTE